MPNDGQFDAFLSHNSQDKPVVRELADALETFQLRVWLDERELRPGLTWMDALEQILRTCKAAAVCVGPNGIGPWVEPEMQALLRRFVREKQGQNILPVIPVLLPGAPEEPILPLFLEAFTWVDLRDGLGEKGIEKLVWGITGNKPVRTQAMPQTARPVSAERLAELTALARQSIAAAAIGWIDTQCAPFVVPSLLRQKSLADGREMADCRQQWEPLTENEVEALIHGRLPEAANRLRIIGDSGMGKTALLHHCEARVASAEDGCLPIRVEGLSGYDWQGSRGALLEMIAERLLHAHLPQNTTDQERRNWLEQLVDGGKVVFLLDALDQTDEQLNYAGLRGFLQCAGVAGCPVLITLRPEVEASAVFASTVWSTLRTDAFDERRQREFLGDVQDLLLPTEDEAWRDPESHQRKLQWADLLAIPLLLKMMRELVVAGRRDGTSVELGELRSRHALYRQAVAYLVKKGLESSEASRFRGRLDGMGDVIEFLTEIGWLTVCQGEGNFTAVLEGDPFRQLRRQQRAFLPALKQVDLVTRHAVLDDYDNQGLAWRHRSFSEYFAGLQLARMDSDERRELLQRHARDPRWHWVFRFALCEVSRRGTQSVTDELAADLICFGNPFLLLDAIDQDGITVTGHIERLCRWLVHRDSLWSGRDYRAAWQEPDAPEMDARWIGILESLFERANRDSSCLHPAWQLVAAEQEAWAVGIRQRFLAEFSGMLADRICADFSGAEGLVAPTAFVRCPPDAAEDGKVFRMGSPDGDADALSSERPQHEVRLSPFYLQRTPVTNSQFELFDPSHRFRRDPSSPGDDHPAFWVSWYMAELYCTWLGESSRLPTEAEWEYACRAGTTTRYSFGDDPATLGDYGWFGENSGGQSQPVGTKQPNPWGLVDMHGNVWEWCYDWYGEYRSEKVTDPVGPPEGAVRVLRSGCWVSPAVGCRSAYRSWLEPENRFDGVGFRVARSPSGK